MNFSADLQIFLDALQAANLDFTADFCRIREVLGLLARPAGSFCLARILESC